LDEWAEEKKQILMNIFSSSLVELSVGLVWVSWTISLKCVWINDWTFKIKQIKQNQI
jgi:hypothetical protein